MGNTHRKFQFSLRVWSTLQNKMFSPKYSQSKIKVKVNFLFNLKFIPCYFAPTNMLTNLLFSFQNVKQSEMPRSISATSFMFWWLKSAENDFFLNFIVRRCIGFGIFVLAARTICFVDFFDSLVWDIQFKINGKQNTFLPARLLCKFIRLLASPESRLYSRLKYWTILLF